LSELLSINDKKKLDEIKTSLQQVVRLRLEITSKKDLAFILSAMAKVRILEGDWRKAAVLFGFVNKSLAELNRKNDNADWKQDYGSDLAFLKQKLPQPEFEIAWQAGWNTTLEELLQNENIITLNQEPPIPSLN
jgi:hypothetical protein